LVVVEVNYDYGTTIYASSRDEEVRVHKEQGCGMTCANKCGKCIHDPTQ